MAKSNKGISKRKNASGVRMSAAELKKLVPEKEHQASIIAHCKRIGLIIWRNNVGVATYGERNQRKVVFGTPGMPDIMGYIPANILSKIKGCNHNFAMPFFWEVKRVGGKATPLQKNFIETAIDSGCFAGIGTYDDFLKSCRLFGL